MIHDQIGKRSIVYSRPEYIINVLPEWNSNFDWGVQCNVTAVTINCDDEIVTDNKSIVNISKVEDGAMITFAHDIRVEPFARVITRHAKQTYQLSVDISWQLPPNSLLSFLLSVWLLWLYSDEIPIQVIKFYATLKDTEQLFVNFISPVLVPNWNAQPRFHFTSESLFEFDEAYDIKLRSLLKTVNQTAVLQKHILMPHHPDYYSDPVTEHDSNLQASRWTGGFRRILVHSIARTIQVEFVGAPAHYCFEGYEVRLKDESGLELLRSAIVPLEMMYMEYVGNQTILFGEYNFTDLEVDQYFMPSVIPIERSRDGRCLCPVLSTNPFDNRMVCSCIAADWHKVRIQRVEKPLSILPEVGKNNTLIFHSERNSSGYIWTVLLAIVFLVISLLIFFLLYILYLYHIRHRLTSKAVRIRFITDHPPPTTLCSSRAPLIHSGLISFLNLKQTFLVSAQLNVLLIYSHDSSLHEECVLLFAEYLRNIFNFNVHLDVWDIVQIERNLLDYISASILNADKVVVINSEGAYYHYRCKIEQEYLIERKEPQPLDSLFDKQIDQVLVHSSVISARFKYTQPSFVLPPLSCSLQYIIPDNISAFIYNLSGSITKNDSRIVSHSLAYSKLLTAVTETSKTLENNPGWFIASHWRVARPISIDKQNRIAVRNDIDKSIKESNNNDVKTVRVLTEPELLPELPHELITASRSVVTVSSGINFEAESSMGALQIQMSASTHNSGDEENNPTSQSDQPNNFPLTDGSNSFGKPFPTDGHALHDSGFISGKNITNT
uniref:SEFIR domain-containing protein n=1 Tax=Setaria digitata TaxID=48799 RepID=A0A915PH93_9BILA